MTNQPCPRCGAVKIRPAGRKTVPDRILSALTIYPYRCQLCAARFRLFLGRRQPAPRRSFERISVHFPVWFKSRWAPPQQTGHEGVVENLSLRGCRIRSPMPLVPGARVELEFQYADTSFPITVDEAVVRSVTEQGIGLRFVRLQREDERRLRQIVDVWLPEPSDTAQ